ISNNYPSPKFPQKGTFVYELIQKFIQLEHGVTVISPYKIDAFPRRKYEYGKDEATVYRPIVLSFSNIKILRWNTYHIGKFFQVRAIRGIILNRKPRFDVIYAH